MSENAVTPRVPIRRKVSFLTDERAVAAVEMALIAPVALIMLFLIVAAGQTLMIYHKVVLAAHTVTDLVSRTPYVADPNTQGGELVPQSTVQNDLALAQMVLYPWDPSNLTASVSELSVNASNNVGTVVWSEPYPSTASAPKTGSTVSLDPNYTASGAPYLLSGQVTYTFQPLGGVLSLPPITLTASEILIIRNATQITEEVGS